MALGEKNESFEAELVECSSQLSLATQLINNLLRWAGLSCDFASVSHDAMCCARISCDSHMTSFALSDSRFT